MQKPVYRRVWFWLLAAAALIAVASWLRSPEVMFRLNRGKFEQAAQDMLAERETDVKIFGVHDIDIWGFDDGAMVEFTTGRLRNCSGELLQRRVLLRRRRPEAVSELGQRTHPGRGRLGLAGGGRRQPRRDLPARRRLVHV